MLKEILRTAWKITRQNPILWLYGFFAAPLVNLEISFFVNFLNQSKQFLNYFSQGPLSEKISFGSKLIEIVSSISIQNAIILFLMAIIFLALVIFASIFLINTLKFFEQEPEKKLSLKIIIASSTRFLGVVFFCVFLNLLILGLIFLIFNLFLPQLLAEIINQKVYLILVLTVILPILFILSLAIPLITKFAIFYAILEKNNFGQAIKNAYFFLIKNWFSILSLFFVLILISFILGLGTFLFFLLTSILFLKIASFFYFLGLSNAFLFVFILSLIIYLGVTFFIGAFFPCFQCLAWLSLFKLFKGKISQN